MASASLEPVLNDQVYPIDAFAPVTKQLGRQLIEEKVVAAVSMPSRDQ